MTWDLDHKLGMAAGISLILGVLALDACTPRHAFPQEHEHGVNVPDWYDEGCCNKQDCRPVPYEDVEEIGPDKWLHKPTGLVFENVGDDEFDEDNYRYQVRPSQDGRFHVCFTETSRGVFSGYCIYVIKTGV